MISFILKVEILQNRQMSQNVYYLSLGLNDNETLDKLSPILYYQETS